MSAPKKVTNIVQPLAPSKYQSHIVYSFHINSPASGRAATLKIEGLHDVDLKEEAREIFKLLVEHGWMSNPVMSRNVHFEEHTSFHAEYEDAKKPSPPKV